MIHERLEKILKRFDELQHLLASPESLADREQYNKYAKELSGLKAPVDLYNEYQKTENELRDIEGVLKEKHDDEFLKLASQEKEELTQKSTELLEKIEKVLKGEDKELNKDVIVEIRQGTGGKEAALFVADLFRMYSKYAALKGWTVEQMSSHPTELGGFKEIIFSVHGKEAYKRLKFESGVHRVQRVPETESQGRIHTSTVTVAVLVEPETQEMSIEPKDLKIDTYRSSGPGGQHMQKTDSAVRITHLPTGLVVACQDERSQIKNKNKAMRILSARLLDKKREEESKKISQERKAQIGTGDRSEKIRTYNYPDRRVTDHRINLTLHKIESILEGDLDEISDTLINEAEKKAHQIHE